MDCRNAGGGDGASRGAPWKLRGLHAPDCTGNADDGECAVERVCIVPCGVGEGVVDRRRRPISRFAPHSERHAREGLKHEGCRLKFEECE